MGTMNTSTREITWMHISDLHFRETTKEDAKIVFQSLLEDLAEIQKPIEQGGRYGLKPDFIFVSGDIAFSSQPTQYQLAIDFFDDLLGKAGLEKKFLFMVPGNHDVDRSVVLADYVNKKLDDHAAVRKALTDPQDRKGYMGRFHNFFDFTTHYLGKEAAFSEENYYRVETRHFKGVDISVLCLNSAWRSYDDGDRANLLVGEHQVRQALQKSKADASPDALRIALMHHPFEWLAEKDQEFCSTVLHDECSFILHGHLHKSGMSNSLSFGNWVTNIAGGACYESIDYTNRYNYVKLDLETGKGNIFLRVFSKEGMGFWTQDSILHRRYPDGIVPFCSRPPLIQTSEKEPIGGAGKPLLLGRFRNSTRQRSDPGQEIYQATDGSGREVHLVVIQQPLVIPGPGADVLRSLKHTNLVSILDVGQVDGRSFMAYERVNAPTLKEEISQRAQTDGQLARAFSVEETVSVLCALGAGLEHLHNAKIVHGSLNPENIWLPELLQPKIGGTGLLYIRPTGMLWPLSYYASPEQILHEQATPQSDLWALGVIGYQMLTGRLPFGALGESDFAVRQEVLMQWPIPPEVFGTNVTPWLSKIILKLLSRQGEDRFQTAEQVVDALKKGDTEVATRVPASDVCEKTLYEHLCAGNPMIFLYTEEEERALAIIQRAVGRIRKEMSGRDLPLMNWTVTQGVAPLEEGAPISFGLPVSPQEVLRKFTTANKPGVLVLRDYHPYLGIPTVQRMMLDFYERPKVWQPPKELPTCVIFVSYDQPLPEVLQKAVQVVYLDPPGEEEIRAAIENKLKAQPEEGQQISPLDVYEFTALSSGMAMKDIQRAMDRSITRCGAFTPAFRQDLLYVKGEVVRQTNLLEYIEPGVDFDQVGGMDLLREQVRWMGKALQMGAWMPIPRGWLLLGASGTGKSLCVRAIAGEWDLPLLRLDLSRIFEPKIGSSEANLRQMIELVERLSPAILWIDEIEKALAGSDDPTISRLFSTLLAWLQEHTAPVFILATSNERAGGDESIFQQAPELFRPGRFDAIYYIDLPVKEERIEILHILLRKYKIPDGQVGVSALAAALEHATGVEIEQCLIDALYAANHQGRALPGTEDIRAEIQVQSAHFMFASPVGERLQSLLREKARSVGALPVSSLAEQLYPEE
jgi:serine/threonine protein kinase/AAA+ superfamily predicted ATPase/predicted MPP superfamily phosphohydrolase